MSEPNLSVTPKSDSKSTPLLPPCNVPYRWILHLGRCVSVYFDPRQPEAVWAEHQHSEIQILYFGSGVDCTIFWANDGEWHSRQVQVPSLWVLEAGISHKLEWRKPALCLVLYVQPSFVKDIARIEIGGAFLFPLEIILRHDPRIAEHLSEFDVLEQPSSQAGVVHVESIGSLITVALLRIWGKLIHEAWDDQPGGLSYAVIARIETLIEQRMDQKIVLADMAKEAGMSTNHFMRLFKRRMGISPGRYLIGKRIQRSKTLVLKTEMRIGEIAYAVGFSNQGHFDLFFKKWVGVTPSEYRTNGIP